MKMNEIVEKLKKLIAKEESCRKIGNAEEAAVYAAKITEWCLRYKIEAAELRTEDEPDAKISRDDITVGDRYYQRANWWHVRIVNIVCAYTGCAQCLRGKTSCFMIYGKEEDRALAIHLLRLLSGFLSKESQRHYDRQYYRQVEKMGWPVSVLRGCRDSWITGAMDTIENRLQEMGQKVEQDTGACVALVLKKDCEKAEDFMYEEHPDLKTVNFLKRRIYNGDAYKEGAEAAKKVNLTRPLNGAKPVGKIN